MPHALIVDDDAAVRTLIGALLARQGFIYDFAPDGNEAIAKLRRNRFDVVILDLMMPVASGFDVVQFMRREQEDMLQRTIVVSAASTRTLEEFDESVVAGVLRKPFDIHLLASMVDQCVNVQSNKER